MSRQRIHYWITGSWEGKDFLIYGGTSEAEAQRKGYEKLPCVFEVIPLGTSEITRASRLLKGRKLEETQDLTGNLERLKHVI